MKKSIFYTDYDLKVTMHPGAAPADARRFYTVVLTGAPAGSMDERLGCGFQVLGTLETTLSEHVRMHAGGAYTGAKIMDATEHMHNQVATVEFVERRKADPREAK